MGITPSLITQGSKILCFTEPNFSLKFIDSLSFLTMKLSAMPKALGFDHQKEFELFRTISPSPLATRQSSWFLLSASGLTRSTARATVYPPRALYFPVLPHKISAGKLVFTLCRACAEINNQEGPCSHSDKERALTGVWVSVEFSKALNLRYTVAEITEVWHFKKQSSTIFKDYIHTFLKGKQEASGYPADATDEESRLNYIEDYRNDLAQTTIVSKPDEFFNFLFSCKYTIAYFHFLTDEMCMIQWKYNRGCISPPNKSCLERVQEKVLYIDTDSLIYMVKDGDAPLELGNYLGDLTDELGGDTIKEFVALGPKSYAYQTRDRKKVVMRVKGITQTHKSSQRVNFDSVKDLVESFLQGARGGVIEALQRTIRRDEKRFHLQNATFQKRFCVVYDKRTLFADGTTLPFGY
ncbi:unnamed protein product [Menidia menidia]|uniref:(Atlantic silverside) hypothetical protein n=1 Tax=Menidia menidia TaxID=238744 RepID=A0A8S4BHP3_9TELE|nr:unnamed protein product [Menidia menidia]